MIWLIPLLLYNCSYQKGLYSTFCKVRAYESWHFELFVILIVNGLEFNSDRKCEAWHAFDPARVCDETCISIVLFYLPSKYFPSVKDINIMIQTYNQLR